MSLKLYGGRMGSSLRCHWAMHELGLTYEEGAVNMAAGEHKSETFLAINPAGQVPALEHDGFALAESLAINNYLVELAGSDLGGADAKERAKAWQWSLWTSFNLYPSFSVLAKPKWTGVENDAATNELARAELAKQLPVLETLLTKHAYVAGERFTVGDINVAVALGYAAFSGYDLSAYARIQAWLGTVTSRPAYAAARGA